MAVGALEPGARAWADAPEPVGEVTTLLPRLRERGGPGTRLLVGFDFPIGLPSSYAERTGIVDFPEFLRKLMAEDRPEFFQVAGDASEISLSRPFFPRGNGKGATRGDLVSGLGVASFEDLYRECERREGRRPACSLFWTLGGNQVGKGSISGWRDVVGPALVRDPPAALWPFDGDLARLLADHEVVLAETYPAEFYSHLGALPGSKGKKSREGRRPACDALTEAATGLGVALAQDATLALKGAFGDSKDGEDRFDAFVGLVGMLAVVKGRRGPGPPDGIRRDVLDVEGWILGQH